MKVKPKLCVLEGSENYTQWNHRVSTLLISLKLAVIVIDGAIPLPEATIKELEAFSLMQQDGITILNYTVKDRKLDAITIENPYLLWTYLKSKFFRDSPYNFVVQEYNLHSLHFKVDVSHPLTENFDTYEKEHGKLFKLLKNSSNPIYSNSYHDLLRKDVIKKNQLLTALVPHNPLLVDNLMYNTELSYKHTKNRLIHLPCSQFRERFKPARTSDSAAAGIEKAMVVVGPPQLRMRNRESGTERVECFYCHKVRHKIVECRKRKATLELEKDNSVNSEKNKLEKDTKDSSSVKDEKALVTGVARTKPQSSDILSPYQHMMVLQLGSVLLFMFRHEVPLV